MHDNEHSDSVWITGGPQSLVMNNRTILTFTPEGEVVFGEGIEPSEAAREFWTFLAHMNPLRGTVAKLEAENAAMREIVQDMANALPLNDRLTLEIIDKARALLAQQAE